MSVSVSAVKASSASTARAADSRDGTSTFSRQSLGRSSSHQVEDREAASLDLARARSMIERDKIAGPTHSLTLVLLGSMAARLGEDRVEAITPAVSPNRMECPFGASRTLNASRHRQRSDRETRQRHASRSRSAPSDRTSSPAIAGKRFWGCALSREGRSHLRFRPRARHTVTG
jgi:hypothetical protein